MSNTPLSGSSTNHSTTTQLRICTQSVNQSSLRDMVFLSFVLFP